MPVFPRKINPATGEGVLEAFEDFMRLVRTQAYTGINNAAYVVYDESQLEVPVYTGALKQSGRVEGDKREDAEKSNQFYRVVAYGQGKKVNPTINAPDGYVRYAIQVHEEMGRSRRPKYLEDPAKTTLQQQKSKVYEALKKVTKGAK